MYKRDRIIRTGSSKPRTSGSPEAFMVSHGGQQHVPQRTCIGCRGKDDRNVLIRLVRSGADGLNAVVVDQYGRMPGRGAWLHSDPDCLEMAVRRRSFNRAFRAPVVSDSVKDFFSGMRAAHSGTAREVTVQCESGSEN